MAYFAPYLDAGGIHLPTYEDRLQDLLTAYRQIFGLSSELSPAVPDYQLLSVFAKALDDTSALVLAAYNSRNPATASGQALDLLLPQVGLSRLPGETDAAARARYQQALSAKGIFTTDAMKAALMQIPNVSHVAFRINDEDTESGGIPAHSISVCVENGNSNKVAETIWQKKPPGIGTWGTTTRNVVDEKGDQHIIRFFRPAMIMVYIHISLRSYAGFNAEAVQTAMRNALMDYINVKLDIGEAINIPQLYGMLYRAAAPYASTFAISDLVFSSTQGEEREKLIPDWNGKYAINTATDISFTITT